MQPFRSLAHLHQCIATFSESTETIRHLCTSWRLQQTSTCAASQMTFASRPGIEFTWKGRFTRCCLAILLVGTGYLPAAVHAQSQFHQESRSEVFHVISGENEMALTERFSKVIELKNRITRVDGFDPAILTVNALTPHRIRVQAVTSGVTTLVLVDEFDNNYSVEVFVEGDVRHLQSYITRFFPDSSVSAVKVKDSVVLRGVVADPAHISQITEVAGEFFPKVINHMQFGSANQVRLQVRIMEAQRSRIRQLGFNWSLLTGGGYVASNPGNLATPGDVSLGGGGNTVTYGGAGLSDSAVSFGVVNSSNIFRGFLEALKQEGLLRVLVESSVVADSGRPASLLSGGEFPILVPQALGTLSVEWREFGVKLEAVPIVLGKGQLILEIAPEFSERDFANAAVLNGTTIPAITTRRANTQVRMKFGQTLMIGGLIATRYTSDTDKVPFLGELPGIGAAFRRVRYDENETELIILVTPEYVAPLSPCQVPEGGPGAFSDVPTDRELFGQGLMEVPNYGGPTPPGYGPPADFGPNYDVNSYETYGTPPEMMSYPADTMNMPVESLPMDSSQLTPMPYGPGELGPSETMPPGEPMPMLPLPKHPMESTEPPSFNSSVPALPPAEMLEESRPAEEENFTEAGWLQSRGKANVQLASGTEKNSPPSLIKPTFKKPSQESGVSAPQP